MLMDDGADECNAFLLTDVAGDSRRARGGAFRLQKARVLVAERNMSEPNKSQNVGVIILLTVCFARLLQVDHEVEQGPSS